MTIARIDFSLPTLPFALVAAMVAAGITVALLWLNRPASGCERVRTRTIVGLLVVAALCGGAARLL